MYPLRDPLIFVHNENATTYLAFTGIMSCDAWIEKTFQESANRFPSHNIYPHDPQIITIR